MTLSTLLTAVLCVSASAATTAARSGIATPSWLRVGRGGFDGFDGEEGPPVEHPKTMPGFEHVLEAAGPDTLVVIDFSAQWCGPCKQIAPHYEALAAEHMPPIACPLEERSVIFMKVDVDEVRDASAQFNVKSLPTFVFLKGGKEVSRFEGASMQLLKQNVQQHI
mmetsp:Transcript_50753/g.142685  ORF Transcript_50753/g.142685 Transcript_50753/m.142685 type:complete len:165 (-) Transcript_50753:98-592(-)